MKKFLRCVTSLALVFVVVFSLTGCKTKLSKTTTSLENVKTVKGVSTNGGITAVYGDYLYFINGTKTNDGTSSKKNKKSAIYRIKYNIETGKTSGDAELVVDNLVGYSNGSIYFYGDFMYYTTPSSEKNSKGTVLYYKTKFMRYDLVNKKSYDLYTTKLNSEDEEITYSYYIVGDSLNLVVYEDSNATITSLKIGDKVSTNYVISDVKSCVLSENNGTCVTDGKTTDANNFVYYTLAHGDSDRVQTGVKVYRTSPAKNNSYLLADNGEDIALLCIRNGKLLYSVDDIVYVESILGTNTEKLTMNITNAISFKTYDNVIFMENEDGSISFLYYDEDTYQIAIPDWKTDDNGQLQINNKTISILNKSESFEFVGIATVDEIVVEDDESTTDIDETVKEEVKFLIYIDSNIAYKLEIARKVGDEFVITEGTEPIKLSATKIQTASGLIKAEAIGNYLFAMAEDDDKNIYMYKIDLTKKDDSSKSATFIGVKE